MPEAKPWHVSLDGAHRREWYPNHWCGQHQGNGCVMLSPTSTFWGPGSEAIVVSLDKSTKSTLLSALYQGRKQSSEPMSNLPVVPQPGSGPNLTPPSFRYFHLPA